MVHGDGLDAVGIRDRGGAHFMEDISFRGDAAQTPVAGKLDDDFPGWKGDTRMVFFIMG
jgi:hypothetical protein